MDYTLVEQKPNTYLTGLSVNVQAAEATSDVAFGSSHKPVDQAASQPPRTIFPQMPQSAAHLTAPPEAVSSSLPEMSASANAAPDVSGDATDFADVQLELPAEEEGLPVQEAAAEPITDSVDSAPAASGATAAAAKSIWKMLSLRPSKAEKESSRPAQDQLGQLAWTVRDQTSQSSLPLPAFTPQADQPVQQAPHEVDVAANVDATSSNTEQQDSLEAAQQPATAAGKRFGFLSSFRRTTAQQSASRSEAMLVETAIPEDGFASLQSAQVGNELSIDQIDASGLEAQAQQQADPSIQPMVVSQQRDLTVGQQSTDSAAPKDAAGSHIELPPVFDYADSEQVQNSVAYLL